MVERMTPKERYRKRFKENAHRAKKRRVFQLPSYPPLPFGGYTLLSLQDLKNAFRI